MGSTRITLASRSALNLTIVAYQAMLLFPQLDRFLYSLSRRVLTGDGAMFAHPGEHLQRIRSLVSVHFHFEARFLVAFLRKMPEMKGQTITAFACKSIATARCQ